MSDLLYLDNKIRHFLCVGAERFERSTSSMSGHVSSSYIDFPLFPHLVYNHSDAPQQA